MTNTLTNTSVARDELRAAIAAVEAAEIAHAKTHEAFERAAAMLAAAEKDVGSFDGLDGRVTEHHASQLYAAISAGSPPPDMHELPSDLQDARAARTSALAKRDAIKAVHAELASDLATSARAAEGARYNRDAAIESVVVEDMDARAAQWLADLAALKDRYRAFPTLRGRIMRFDPNAPRPDATKAQWRPHTIGRRTEEALYALSVEIHLPKDNRAKVSTDEFIAALAKDPAATLA